MDIYIFLYIIIGFVIGFIVVRIWGSKKEKFLQANWKDENSSKIILLQSKLEDTNDNLSEQKEIIKTQKTQIENLREQLSETQSQLAVNKSKAERIPQLESLVEEREGALSRIGDELRKSGAELSARIEQGKRISSLEKDVSDCRIELTKLREDKTRLVGREKELLAVLSKEQEVAQEKMKLIIEARDVLSDQFKNLANEIFDEKSKRFDEQNKSSLDSLLNPLHERIQNFGKLVQDTHEKDSKGRLTLENELRRLQELNAQLNTDALALTNALTGGNNKTQGTWGEMVLETVLESSGLTRGREYEVQVSDTVETEDGGTKRCQADVIINLPENKQLVIDSKVSLMAYLRYTSATDDVVREAELKAHIASIRQHIRSLSEKRYHEQYKINTLDFVFMFVPIEPAYLLAVQQDMGLFNEAFERRIMVVSPSTLLATLRTVANIWRYEDQNQNASEIARQGGAMYDKFVTFAQTLKNLGNQLSNTQNSYEVAMKQLMTGSGNLTGRAEKLRKLGVKANKALPAHMLADSGEEKIHKLSSADDVEESEDNEDS